VPSQEVSNRYEIRIVVHAPGGERHTIKIGAQDHYTLQEAASYIAGIYLTIEKRFAYEEYAAKVVPTLPEAPDSSSGPVRH
jgi:hypothetical protein